MASKTPNPLDEIRKALEGIKTTRFTGGMCKIEQALMVESLKVLDDYAEVKAEYEKALKDRDDDGYREYVRAGMRAGEQQINLIAAILRSAGRIA